MKKFLAIALAASTLAIAAPASAAPWQNVNQRQAQLEHRIDVGVRTGRLTRGEAYRLREEFRDIARMEQRFRRDGLSRRERAILDHQFDRLSAQIYAEMRDRNHRRG